MTNASQRRSLWTAVVAVPLLFAAIFVLQTRIDARTRTEAHRQQELLFRSPAAIGKISLGYNSLLADIYWTRAVQYYGGQLAAENFHFPLLWPMLDISTTLDPKLLPAYHFGAIFLSEPNLGANRPDLAVQLVKRGISANPERWGLYSDLGFLEYWYFRDYHAAAKAYLDGSNTSQGPSWMKMMAARLDQKGGSVETSRMIWTQIYETNSDSKIRKLALETLKGLKAQQDEQQLDALASQYRQRFGRYPASFSEMRDAGLLRGIPVDPDGYPYVLGPDGKSSVNPRSDVIIPAEPKTPPASSAAK
jgi:hypothetical protein